MNKSIVFGLVVLGALAIVWMFAESSPYTTTNSGVGSAGLESLRGLDTSNVARLVLAKGDANPTELSKKGSEWVVGSLYGYPANTEKIDKILEAIGAIEVVSEAGTSPKSHEHFEVDKKKGGRITLLDSGGQELAKLVVGKTAPGAALGTTEVFARFGDEDATYRIESNVRSEASLWGDEVEGKNYLLTELHKLDDTMEIQRVRLTRPDQEALLLERRFREVPKEEPAGAEDGSAEEKEGEDAAPEMERVEYYVATSGTETHEVEKDKEWSAKSFLNRGKTTSIDEATEPKPLTEYGLEPPQLLAVLSYRAKDAVESELQTMNLAFGNAVKDDDGKNESYYFRLDVPPHTERVYLIKSYRFDGWNKALKDFLPDPEPEPEPEPEEEEEQETAVPAGDGDEPAAADGEAEAAEGASE